VSTKRNAIYFSFTPKSIRKFASTSSRHVLHFAIMKYRTIIQINQSDPDLTLNIVEEEDEEGEGVGRRESVGGGNSEEKMKRPAAAVRLSKLFRRKSSQKYDLWKMERRKSVSDSDLIQCSKISPLKPGSKVGKIF